MTAAYAPHPLKTLQYGRYTVEVHVHDTEVYGGSVCFDDTILAAFARDTYEEALLEAGGTIRYHVGQRVRSGLI